MRKSANIDLELLIAVICFQNDVYTPLYDASIGTGSKDVVDESIPSKKPTVCKRPYHASLLGGKRIRKRAQSVYVHGVGAGADGSPFRKQRVHSVIPYHLVKTAIGTDCAQWGSSVTCCCRGSDMLRDRLRKRCQIRCFGRYEPMPMAMGLGERF